MDNHPASMRPTGCEGLAKNLGDLPCLNRALPSTYHLPEISQQFLTLLTFLTCKNCPLSGLVLLTWLLTHVSNHVTNSAISNGTLSQMAFLDSHLMRCDTRPEACILILALSCASCLVYDGMQDMSFQKSWPHCHGAHLGDLPTPFLASMTPLTLSLFSDFVPYATQA